MTHNVAEVWAARDCLAYIEEQLLTRQHKAILIHGDSLLTINFMLCKYKAGQEFNTTIRAMLNMCNRLRKEHKVVVRWEHVPHEHEKQQWAN